ncbi:hypothetical protein H5410_038274 [Solanum commersonii]|uniref:Uncharacterized protein n=1 Tax=Solanum commersonii TaxID=4109 RepID=A0A9J5YA93_SOLCO|nr:hypothetical protein H5410_038274 [Solanum commersonii]
MTQKKMKSMRGTLANREAATPKAAMMKISNSNTTKGNQISDSKKFNLPRCQQKKKKKSIANTTRISDSKKFDVSRCQQQKKKNKKSIHTCQEKGVAEMDIVAKRREIQMCCKILGYNIGSLLSDEASTPSCQFHKISSCPLQPQ